MSTDPSIVDLSKHPRAAAAAIVPISIRWRLLLSAGTTVAVAAMAFFCAWRNLGNNDSLWDGRGITRMKLRMLDEFIERHQQKYGRLPAKLSDLDEAKAKQGWFAEEAIPLDGWRWPIHYQLDAAGYTLCSFGRDGKPGGTGLDADLFANAISPDTERPTFWEFATRPWDISSPWMSIKDLRFWCGMAGAVAFPLFFLQTSGARSSRWSWVGMVVAGALTALFAIFTAGAISALHLITDFH
jgi:hypothetical protein